MEGSFSITVPKESQRIMVKAYTFLEAELNIEDEDSAKALLYYAHPFTFQTITTPPAKKIITSIRRQRSNIDPRKEKNFKYQSYNKFVVTTNYISALKLHLQNLISVFGHGRMMNYGSDHHILLMESSSQRRFKSFYNQRETVVAAKVSGINKPPALSIVSGFEPLSIFEPFLRIGPKKYVSPLAGRFQKRYVYFLYDSIKLSERTIYVIKFNPKSDRNKELLQGFLYVSNDPMGVVAFQVWPSFDRESTFSLLQQSALLTSGRWFPEQIKTTYQRSHLGSVKIPIEASSKTYIFNHEYVNERDTSYYDEVIFDFQKDSLQSDSEFQPRLRQENLSQKDKNTYQFYKEVGSLSAIDRYLTFGQKLAAGKIPFGRVDVVFRKAVALNDVEGLRLGLGIQSTELWSNKHQFGGYLAYGLADERWKYALNYHYAFDKKSTATFSFQNDLLEPGIQQYEFNKLQYPSEQLRAIRIPRFDRLSSVKIGFNHLIDRNLISRISIEGGRRNYLYQYGFAPDSLANGVGISEIKGALHWSPGEQFVQYGTERYSLSSRYPAFWLQFSQGLKGLAYQSFSYSRIEGKVQWTRKILGLGEFGIQIAGGLMSSKVPYALLFTSRASYKDLSLLSYNSFETMRYNEFIQDRFVTIFISHKFSKIQISNLPYRPYFTFLHNMGWGSVGNSELHKHVRVKGIPYGYYESGLFLNDLFVIPIVGLNLGIGGGIFVRYGPYALDGYLNNMAIKFSTSLTF